MIATYPEGLYLKGLPVASCNLKCGILPLYQSKDFPGGDYDCQQIRYRPAGRHSLLGYLGVVVDIDPVYSLLNRRLMSWR